jgi:hypothetical protein
MANQCFVPRSCFVVKPIDTAIAVRAYTERPGREPLGNLLSKQDLTASKWVVVFDCETSTDAAQRLRVGFFQTREDSTLERSGLFIDPEALSRSEAKLIKAYALSRGLEVLTVAEFRIGVLLKYGYTRHATIVGFNLPFDISRIALDHGVARRDKRGGFSFLLTRNNEDPRIRVKHLSPKAAMIDFSKPAEQDTPRGQRKRKQKVAPYRGHFVDVKTLASALLSQRFNLSKLAATLGTPTRKLVTDEHGKLSDAYLDYARTDVQVTWECYEALERRYDEHGLTRAVSKILSEATIGKAYLRGMGIKPLLGCDPKFDRGHFGRILCAYYGGRAEVRNRRVVREVRYCDFKSMYPTVNGLMGLWKFVIGKGVIATETTADTRAFLESVTLADLQNRATWGQLTTLVRVTPNADLFPVRAKYDDRSYTIGLNYLTANTSLWYTLADCIVSKLLTGKCPEIEEAITYRPGPRQEGLKPAAILGRKDYTIHPDSDDFYLSLIDLRDEAKNNGDSIEKTLKIIANSTSYGIFIEINRDDAPKAERLDVFGPNGKRCELETRAIEEPGVCFNPLLGVLITGAARLMLALAEKNTLDAGLDWAFCDTDSLAIMRPAGMSRSEFHKRAQSVVDWFVPLNPYRKPESILKVEDLNCDPKSRRRRPLYCFAISSKRYALFNRGKGNRPVLRKASAHGLGHLVNPYSELEAPPEIPAPSVPLSQIGVQRWQYDFWYKILEAAMCGRPDVVTLDWHPALQTPAAIRYTASSPQLLNWMACWNDDKPYDVQIRPFGFLLSFTPRTGVFAPLAETLVDRSQRGRPPHSDQLAPIAPYDSDPKRALTKVFDRVTGKRVSPEQLRTYAEALLQYHVSCEDKFVNGRFLNCGRTERRHVVATGFAWIGKEANSIGESGEADPIRSTVEEFAVGASRAVCF